MRKRIVSSVIGGLILFAWGFVGHVVLGIYDPAFRGFVDEAAVAEALSASAPASGLYYVPADPDYAGPPATEALVNYVEAGDRSGFGAMSVRGFLIQVASVFLVLSLFAPGPGTGYWPAVGRFAAAGFLLSFVVHGYYWNWFDFPGLYFATALVDGTVGWALVGLALGRRAEE